MRALLLIAGVFFFSSASAQTQDSGQEPTAPTQQAVETQTAQPEQPAEEELECRSYRVLGSRIAVQRICRTRATWQAEEERARGMSDDISRRSLQQCIPNAGGSCGG